MALRSIVISGSASSHLSLKTHTIPGALSSLTVPTPSLVYTRQLGLMQVAGDQDLRTKEQEVPPPAASWAPAVGAQAPVDILSSLNLGG